MKSLPRLTLLCLAVLALPALALAHDAASTPDSYDPLGIAHLLFQAIMGKRWPEVGVILLMGGVILIRKVGQTIRDALPDDSLPDRFLTFMLTSKAGGWILNFLTAAGGSLMVAVTAHEPLTLEVCKMAFILGLAGAGGWEGTKDLVGPLLDRWLKLPTPAVPAPAPAAPFVPPTSEADAAKRLGGLAGGGGGV